MISFVLCVFGEADMLLFATAAAPSASGRLTVI